MAINIEQIQKLTSPNPFALVSTRKQDGTTNLMALSWWTYVSNRPPTVAVCLSSKGFSGELIRANGEFGLNIVNETLKEAAFLCGTCSGRTENKPEKFSIALTEPLVIGTKLVEAHKVALECRLVKAVQVSDHVMYIAEVVEGHSVPGRRQLYAINGYGVLDTI
jgi:flavin reductase (DIM6/NTAB) family NADH-FMN oxidoreductase RutF